MRDTKGRKRWVTLVLAAALIAALVLTACENGGNGGPTPRPWVVSYGHGGGSMSGWFGVDPMSGAEILQPLSGDMLSGFDMETKEPVRYLATNVTFNHDELYSDHWIREGIPFHNGDNMTAEDVAFSYNRMLDSDVVGFGPATAWSVFLDYVEVINDYQVRMHWHDMGSPVRIVNPFQAVIVPKDYIEGVGWEEWADSPVMTGPMKVVDWQRDVYIHLEKAFPEEGHWYWDDIPNYDELWIWSVPETSTRLSMLKTGELDMANIGRAHIPEVDADLDLTLIMEEYVYPWSILFCDWANNDSPLSDPMVREAVSLAIDRASIAENVLYGSAVPYGSYWAPYTLGYEYREPDAHDPDTARDLLTAAGYPAGIDTFLHYPQSEEVPAQAVIGSLLEVGIRVEAQPYELMTWYQKYANDEFDGMTWAPLPVWAGAYYPDQVFGDSELGWGAPVSGDIPEVQEAFDQMLASETEEEMIAAAQAAEELVLDTLGYRLIVWAMHWPFAYGPTIEDWDPSSGLLTATYKG